jgi:competence protein ComEC
VRGIPLLPLGMALLVGMWLDASLNLSTIHVFHFTVFLLTFYLIISRILADTKRNTILIKSIIILSIIVTFGAILNGSRSSCRQSIPDSLDGLQIIHIKKQESRSSNKSRFLAFHYSKTDKTWKRTYKLFLYANNNLNIQEGMILATINKPQRIRATHIDGIFDFASYAALQDVNHTLHLSFPQSYICISSVKKDEKPFLEKSRNNILFLIRKMLPNAKEAGLAEALLIGYRGDMDPELNKAYLDTGVVHVIAISGMHLGLIFGIINAMMMLGWGRRGSRWTGLLISLPLLWVFSIITGASASVLRSVIMYTFSIIGNSINRRNNGVNTLIGSALVLMVYDPDIIRDIGFQLSYSAVLSIMLFSKLIESWLYFRNPLLGACWKLIAMTLAAQVLTSPFVIYHFQRFPTLFLFTNLVAIPLSSLLLILLIFLLIVSPVQLLSTFIIQIIQWCMYLMNSYIEVMAKVPFGMIVMAKWTKVEIIIGSLFLISLLLLISRPSRYLWRMMITSHLLFSTAYILRITEQHKIKQTIIMNTKKGAAIVHQHGYTVEIMIPQSPFVDEAITNQLGRVAQAYGGKSIKWKTFPDCPLIIHDRPNFILLHGINQFPKIELKNDRLKSRIIITDASIKMWKIKQWQKAAHGVHLPFHSTRDEGPVSIACHQHTQN